MGADRALNIIAAHDKHPGDLIVIDFGTATTFEVADYEGNYKGGIIAPGINLSLDALVSAAAKLPRVAIEAPQSASVIGLNTADQMHIGIYWGYIAMIEGLLARVKAQIGGGGSSSEAESARSSQCRAFCISALDRQSSPERPQTKVSHLGRNAFGSAARRRCSSRPAAREPFQSPIRSRTSASR